MPTKYNSVHSTVSFGGCNNESIKNILKEMDDLCKDPGSIEEAMHTTGQLLGVLSEALQGEIEKPELFHKNVFYRLKHAFWYAMMILSNPHDDGKVSDEQRVNWKSKIVYGYRLPKNKIVLGYEFTIGERTLTLSVQLDTIYVKRYGIIDIDTFSFIEKNDVPHTNTYPVSVDIMKCWAKLLDFCQKNQWCFMIMFNPRYATELMKDIYKHSMSRICHKSTYVVYRMFGIQELIAIRFMPESNTFMYTTGYDAHVNSILCGIWKPLVSTEGLAKAPYSEILYDINVPQDNGAYQALFVKVHKELANAIIDLHNTFRPDDKPWVIKRSEVKRKPFGGKS